MTTEKVMELSTDILCALIKNGHLPAAALHGVDNSSLAVLDYLYGVAKSVKRVEELLEEDRLKEPE